MNRLNIKSPVPIKKDRRSSNRPWSNRKKPSCNPIEEELNSLTDKDFELRIKNTCPLNSY